MVLKARNEEGQIAHTLESLERQTLRPSRLIVVDDGSTDHTADVVSEYEVELVRRPPRDESYLARKELAQTVNAGLDVIRHDYEFQYVCLSDADTIYPESYLHTITQRMDQDPSLAVTSGTIKSEFSVMPRGTGRVVRAKFWRQVGFSYPVNYGYESWLLYKAASIGYTYIVYTDLQMDTSRRTGSRFQPKTYRYYGKGMRALGYRPEYVIARCVRFLARNPGGAMEMLRGYCSSQSELYEPDVRNYVRRAQPRLLRSRVCGIGRWQPGNQT